MDDRPLLTVLSEAERAQALQRFRILQPYLEGQRPLAAIAQEQAMVPRTLQRWAARYQEEGLAGLALQKARTSAAAIHRQVVEVPAQQGWDAPSYSFVHDIVRRLDPAMVLLAHAGSKAYQNACDLVVRPEASRPNESWQADHTSLDLWLVDEDGQPARPWLTVVEDDYSRCIAGYFVTFARPNSLNTALSLRQIAWRKPDPRWRICGIPDTFYSDHGSDFTSQPMEQICADLKIQLVFSTTGIPRGRGKIERFFRTVNQLLLVRLPG